MWDEYLLRALALCEIRLKGIRNGTIIKKGNVTFTFERPFHLLANVTLSKGWKGLVNVTITAITFISHGFRSSLAPFTKPISYCIMS